MVLLIFANIEWNLKTSQYFRHSRFGFYLNDVEIQTTVVHLQHPFRWDNRAIPQCKFGIRLIATAVVIPNACPSKVAQDPKFVRGFELKDITIWVGDKVYPRLRPFLFELFH